MLYVVRSVLLGVLLITNAFTCDHVKNDIRVFGRATSLSQGNLAHVCFSLALTWPGLWRFYAVQAKLFTYQLKALVVLIL